MVCRPLSKCNRICLCALCPHSGIVRRYFHENLPMRKQRLFRRRSDGFSSECPVCPGYPEYAGGKPSGNAPIRAASLQQFLLWMSSVRFQFLPERFQPLSTDRLMLHKRFFRDRTQFLCCTAKLFSRYFSAQQLC